MGVKLRERPGKGWKERVTLAEIPRLAGRFGAENGRSEREPHDVCAMQGMKFPVQSRFHSRFSADFGPVPQATSILLSPTVRSLLQSKRG